MKIARRRPARPCLHAARHAQVLLLPCRAPRRPPFPLRPMAQPAVASTRHDRLAEALRGAARHLRLHTGVADADSRS